MQVSWLRIEGIHSTYDEAIAKVWMQKGVENFYQDSTNKGRQESHEEEEVKENEHE